MGSMTQLELQLPLQMLQLCHQLNAGQCVEMQAAINDAALNSSLKLSKLEESVTILMTGEIADLLETVSKRWRCVVNSVVPTVGNYDKHDATEYATQSGFTEIPLNNIKMEIETGETCQSSNQISCNIDNFTSNPSPSKKRLQRKQDSITPKAIRPLDKIEMLKDRENQKRKKSKPSKRVLENTSGKIGSSDLESGRGDLQKDADAAEVSGTEQYTGSLVNDDDSNDSDNDDLNIDWNVDPYNDLQKDNPAKKISPKQTKETCKYKIRCCICNTGTASIKRLGDHMSKIHGHCLSKKQIECALEDQMTYGRHRSNNESRKKCSFCQRERPGRAILNHLETWHQDEENYNEVYQDYCQQLDKIGLLKVRKYKKRTRSKASEKVHNLEITSGDRPKVIPPSADLSLNDSVDFGTTAAEIGNCSADLENVGGDLQKDEGAPNIGSPQDTSGHIADHDDDNDTQTNDIGAAADDDVDDDDDDDDDDGNDDDDMEDDDPDYKLEKDSPPKKVAPKPVKRSCKYKIRCPKCNVGAATIKRLGHHMSKVHGNCMSKKEIDCALEDQMTYGRHRSDSDSRMKCPFCPRERPGSAILNHLNTWHQDEKRFCEVHQDFYKQLKKKGLMNIRNNMFWWQKLKDLICCHCDKQFDTKESLLQHKRTECQKNKILMTRSLQCYSCDYKAKDRDDLARHRKSSHSYFKTDEVCELCGARFNSRGGLRIHLRVKHGVVGKRMDQQTEWTCETCGKVFQYKGRYKRHLLTHTDSMEATCDICGKMYKTRYDLQVHHKRIHLNIYPYHCQRCGHGLQRKEWLATHKCENVKQRQPRDKGVNKNGQASGTNRTATVEPQQAQGNQSLVHGPHMPYMGHTHGDLDMTQFSVAAQTWPFTGF